VTTFNLEPRNFKPVKATSQSDKITFTVHWRGPGSLRCVHGHKHKEGSLLGYIVYDGKKGLLELTNLEARLERRALDLGGTTKSHDAKSAGEHGEGFKVGALVMLRAGHHVRIESSGFSWNFAFGGNDKRMLYCRLRKSERQLENDNTAASTPNPTNSTDLKARIWDDVSITVGKVPRSKGIRVETPRVENWFEAALDLDPPDDIVRTETGDLLLGVQLKQTIFIKGLRSPALAENLKYGYNFLTGKVNRDRQRLASPREEAVALARIWAAAMSQRERLAEDYVSMFETANTRWGDINLASEYLSPGAAAGIWRCLLHRSRRDGVFYHNDSQVEKVCDSSS
jgi:hypothetical protein